MDVTTHVSGQHSEGSLILRCRLPPDIRAVGTIPEMSKALQDPESTTLAVVVILVVR
jgi:hypothetical protein